MSKSTEHGECSYGYDGASRLTSADNPLGEDESYSYDEVGNRTSASNAGGEIAHNVNNELTMYGELEYEYDDNGNMTEVQLSGTVVFVYHYNADNRLIKVEGGNNNTLAEYYYDPFGRRLWKDANQTRTYFFYSDEGLIAEFDITGSESRSYGYKPDSTWTTDPLWLKHNNAYYFYHNDHLGTPQKLTAQNGMVAWSATYSAFGEATIDTEHIRNPLRFPGQYYDAETGLHYNYQRYYDPGIGRYVGVDPVNFNGGDVNLYGYVKNNSINTSDALGLYYPFPIQYDPMTGTYRDMSKPLQSNEHLYLEKLPGIANNMGWIQLEQLFYRWFSNSAGTDYDNGRNINPPDTTTITMNWILSYPYAEEVYNNMIQGKIYQNAAALDRIREEPQRVGITRFVSGTFGTPLPSVMNSQWHEAHELNYRSVEGNMLDSEDALFAALANFNLYVAITQGEISVVNPRYKAACLKVTEIGIYARDSFDFIDDPGDIISQPLGFWSTSFNMGVPFPTPDAILLPWNFPKLWISNDDFRHYQSMTGKGGDFYIFSNVRKISVQNPEWVILPIDPWLIPNDPS